MTTNARRPDYILKHDVKGDDNKTVRSTRIGAMWAPEGNRPGRIKIEYLPVGFDGSITVWNFENESKE